MIITLDLKIRTINKSSPPPSLQLPVPCGQGRVYDYYHQYATLPLSTNQFKY